MTATESSVAGRQASDLRPKVQALMDQARRDLTELVAIRSAADPARPAPPDVEAAAGWVADAFRGAGLAHVELVDVAGRPPVVHGHRPAPPGAPTVLLHCHYDVQPVPDESAWSTPPWQLTERDGRWYGRGAADGKGNVVMHLTALRALGDDWPVGVKLVADGSQEQGTGGLADWVPANADRLRADTILVCDGGNYAAGIPTLTVTLRGMVDVVVTVETLRRALHPARFGGAAPDALAALIHMLATLHDERGDTTIRGLDHRQRYHGVEYPVDEFRRDANVLDGVDLVGSGLVSDMLWARPALTVLGIDCPDVGCSSAAIQPRARARLRLRVPAGLGADQAREALVRHLHAVAPGNARVEVVEQASTEPWVGWRDGSAARAMVASMLEAYGVDAVREGQGGSVPLGNVLHQTFPEAEVMVMGVEEPRCLVHAPDESVDPAEIEAMALTEALFLRSYTG
jgi:cysteinylglycine-S-conjugate dipeptidase